MQPTPKRSPIRPIHALLALAGGLWLLCATTTACAGFRGAVMDLRNDDLLGTTAPDISDGSWIALDGGATPIAAGGADEERNTADERWRLLVFFLPT